MCGFQPPEQVTASGTGFNLTVAVAQLTGESTVAANLAKAESWARRAAAAGADVVITPELQSVG